MRKSIDTYVQSIAHDNDQYILDGGYESVAEYIIATAENGNGFGEFFDAAELQDNGDEPTEEQIDELKDYLNDNYNFVSDVDKDGKIKNLDSIKAYNSNMDVSYRDYNGWNGLNLTYDNFRDDLDLPMREADARDILNESYGIVGAAADKVIDEMFTYEWIVEDDEVYLYQVNITNAYRMDEKGTKWMTHIPHNTEYYKYEEVDRKTEHLPAGFTYDKDSETFFDGKNPAEMVNENDGSVSLVSSERMVKWF